MELAVALVEAAVRGAAGPRQCVAAVAAASIRTVWEIMAAPPSVPAGAAAESEARLKAIAPIIVARVCAGASGGRANLNGGQRTRRNFAEHHDFGYGAAAMEGSRHQLRHKMRRAKWVAKPAAGKEAADEKLCRGLRGTSGGDNDAA